MSQLLRFHVVHMSNGEAVQGFADVLNVIPLYVPHHHDLCLGLHAWHVGVVTTEGPEACSKSSSNVCISLHVWHVSTVMH